MKNQAIAKIKKSLPAEIVDNSPAAVIRAAGPGADLDKLEKLLNLQIVHEANEAKKAYHIAMAAFKANPPKITKDKKVSYQAGSSNVHYNHASLANVVEKIGAELSKYGLSASWTTKQNGAIMVTCKITHAKGHSEETTLSAAADATGSKNAIQQIGSTITYLERYTLLALTGLATYDQDDDGKITGKPAELITEKQLSQLLDMMADVELGAADRDNFLKYLNIEKLEDLRKADFQKAMTALENKKREQGRR